MATTIPSPLPMPAGDYTLAGSGVITDDGRFIPSDPENLDWQAYQSWLVGGNSPNPDPTTLAVLKSQTKDRIDVDADARRSMLFPSGSAAVAFSILRWTEADLAAVDGTPTGAEYPLLNAEVGFNGSTIANVATNVQAERLATKTSMAQVEVVRNTAKAAVDAASTVALVEAVYAAIVWP